MEQANLRFWLIDRLKDWSKNWTLDCPDPGMMNKGVLSLQTYTKLLIRQLFADQSDRIIGQAYNF